MVVDWDIVNFKRKIIDNARYIFKNYIDTSKGLDALYNRPEVSTDSAICHKNLNQIRLTGSTSGNYITAWKIDDAANVNKMYVRAKINVASKLDGSLVLTDSRFANQILFRIRPNSSEPDFKVIFKINGSYSDIYGESVDLSRGMFYDIEGMIDFQNNSISVARDNNEKAALTPDTLPSFDDIHLGVSAYYNQGIPNVIVKDVIITWE